MHTHEKTTLITPSLIYGYVSCVLSLTESFDILVFLLKKCYFFKLSNYNNLPLE